MVGHDVAVRFAFGIVLVVHVVDVVVGHDVAVRFAVRFVLGFVLDFTLGFVLVVQVIDVVRGHNVVIRFVFGSVLVVHIVDVVRGHDVTVCFAHGFVLVIHVVDIAVDHDVATDSALGVVLVVHVVDVVVGIYSVTLDVVLVVATTLFCVIVFLAYGSLVLDINCCRFLGIMIVAWDMFVDGCMFNRSNFRICLDIVPILLSIL